MELVWRADKSGTWANVSFSADQLGVHQYRDVSGHVFQNDARRPIHPGAHDAKPRAIDIGQRVLCQQRFSATIAQLQERLVMEIPRSLSRRQAMKLAAAAAAALRCARPAAAAPLLKGRLKQSAARWCYSKISLEDLARAAAEMGLRGLDLVQDPKDWPTLKKHGLVSSMVTGAGTIPDGFNRKENHDRLEREMRENIR